MNETPQQKTMTHTAEPGKPASLADSNESWPWLIGAGVALLIVLIVLAMKVLKPRDPRAQPPSSL